MPEAQFTSPGIGKRKRRRSRRGRGGRRAKQAVQRVPLEPINLPEVLGSAPLSTYCRDCRAEVTGVLVGTKMNCEVCKGANVAFGTPVSVRNYFRLTGERPRKPTD